MRTFRIALSAITATIFHSAIANAVVSVCAHLGNNGDTPWSFSDFKAELGNRNAAIYHKFMQLNSGGFMGNDPDNFLTAVRTQAPGAEVMLTLELRNDMPTAITDLNVTSYKQIAQRLKKWNDQGMTIHVRLFHESNGRNSDGSTYYKHQVDPATYIRVWRAIAAQVHLATNTSTAVVNGKLIGATRMLWSVMPQNRDSKLNVTDFFPRRDAVDELGLTVITQVPVQLPPRKDGKPNATPPGFVDKLNYTFIAPGETVAKSIYTRYCKEMGKPLIITETSRPTPYTMALDAEVSTKWSWFSELYNETAIRAFPAMRGICYLEMDRAGYGTNMHYGVFGRDAGLTGLARARLTDLSQKGLVKFA